MLNDQVDYINLRQCTQYKKDELLKYGTILILYWMALKVY